MDVVLAVSKIYGGADFNPACFDHEENIARARKLWRDPRPMPTTAELTAALLVKTEQELYAEMVEDIYAEMLTVFGTRNDVSAQATASTYEAMALRPINYVGMAGLVDEAAVSAYASAKIVEADAYAVFRLNRIAQFQTEKAAITNP